MSGSQDRPSGPFPTAGAAPVRPLGAGEVHVWRLLGVGHEQRVRCAASVLDAAERARMTRLAPHAAATFGVTRGTLRHLLGAYLDAPPDTLRFGYGATGKPLLPAAAAAGICFSVTHARGLSLIAVAALRRVGIDAEPVQERERVVRVARRVFAPETGALLERLAGAERTRAFHHAWTLREAHVKALGTGVFMSSDTLPLDWPTPVGPRLREERTDDGTARQWTVAALEPAAGYVATLVAEGSAAAVRSFDAGALLDRLAASRAQPEA